MFDAQVKRSVIDGVFVEKQAARGAQVYHKACASCHMEDLEVRGFAPQLNGGAFGLQRAGGKLSDFHKIIAATMPVHDPGSLMPGEHANVVAFVLKSNGYRPGSEPLSEDPADSAQITFPKN
jgi:quinoprotein glucose dehydrogenase